MFGATCSVVVENLRDTLAVAGAACEVEVHNGNSLGLSANQEMGEAFVGSVRRSHIGCLAKTGGSTMNRVGPHCGSRTKVLLKIGQADVPSSKVPISR